MVGGGVKTKAGPTIPCTRSSELCTLNPGKIVLRGSTYIPRGFANLASNQKRDLNLEQWSCLDFLGTGKHGLAFRVSGFRVVIRNCL